MNIDEFCTKLVARFKLQKRVVYRRSKEPYLTRYYIFRKRFSWLPSLYLHCFHSSDEDMELHNHPWNNSISLILSGSYREEIRDKNDNIVTRILSPGNLNFIRAEDFHRVDLVTDKVWTLFLSGSKVQSWGFWNRDTKEFIPWQIHESMKKKEAAETQNPHLRVVQRIG